MAGYAVPAATQEDLEDLRLLSIAHYVYAGFISLFSLMGVAMAVFGFFVIPNFPDSPGQPPAAFMRFLFGGIGAVIFAMYIGWATVTFLGARYLTRHRRHTYCILIAALDTAWFPVGTVLGVFTLIVLLRPSVKALFTGGPPTLPPA